MADTDEGKPKPETAPKEPLENKAKPVETPKEEKPAEAPSEVEKLQADLKEAQQKAMRVSQVENELAKLKAERDKSHQDELEEKEEFKTLYEQEKAKNEEHEKQRAEDENKKAVDEAAVNVLSDYSDEVKALAEDTGLTLTEVNDQAVTDFKAKLDKIQGRLGNKVTPNNPSAATGKKELSGEELRQTLADPVKRDAYYREKDGVTAMMMEPSKG